MSLNFLPFHGSFKLNFSQNSLVEVQYSSHCFNVFSCIGLQNDLNGTEFSTVYFDGSKPKNIKTVPKPIGYYSATDGSLTRVLNVEAVRGEPPDILSAYNSNTLHAN